MHLKIVHLLVGPDVQGADDHPLAAHGCGDILVGLELLLLGGVVAGRQIQKLRAEQADALAVVGLDGGHILGRADVAVDHHLPAVQGYVLLALHGLHQLFHFLLLGLLGLERGQRDSSGSMATCPVSPSM